MAWKSLPPQHDNLSIGLHQPEETYASQNSLKDYRTVKKQDDIVITKPDKGSGAVIMIGQIWIPGHC